MNKKRVFSIGALFIFITANSYLFITAPPPLENSTNEEGYTFSVNDAFKVMAKLNDECRTLYTNKIVGGGKKVGLKFDEDWRKDDIEAGPLPALFLRETSAYIEKSPIQLGLYLGSDFPISESNLLTGVQAEKFKEIRADKQPKFFYDQETGRNIAMFPDFASAGPCVSCHNGHKNSPKTDWELNDIMGATTWSYTGDSLTTDELVDWISVYSAGAQNTYTTYLEKIAGFQNAEKPTIGEKWSDDGYFLPSVNTFSDTLFRKVSPFLLTSILDKND